jgi:3-oxoacyl-[acyl-carrier-protein] synthase-1
MSERDVVIVGVGMATSVGVCSRQATAEVRSGTARFEETFFVDANYAPIIGSMIPEKYLPTIHPDVQRTETDSYLHRLIRMGGLAIAEVLSPIGSSQSQMPIYLAAPIEAGKRPLVEWLQLQTGIPGLVESGIRRSDRAGGLQAIVAAARAIISGTHDVAVAGGIDSLIDIAQLRILERDGRLKTPKHSGGLIPGEGAGFVALAAIKIAKERNWPILGVLTGFGEGKEVGHLGSTEPYRGDGLAQACATAMNTARGTVNAVYASFNGEYFWAKEWGVSSTRNCNRFSREHAVIHPAEFWGDTRTACGPLMLGLAISVVRPNSSLGEVLVFASSDGPSRCAVTLMGPE